MTRLARTLGEVAAKLEWLEVQCTKCDRAGRLRTARLLETYGPDLPMPDLARRLTAGCPAQAALFEGDRCDVVFPDLTTLSP